MSSASLRPASSHSRRPSTARSHRICDYGDEHVRRSKLEEKEDELLREQSKRKREKEEWESAASDYHEKLAAAQEELDRLNKQLVDKTQELQELEKEHNGCLDDYNAIVEERDAANNDRDRFIEKGKGYQTLLEEERVKTAKLQERVAELTKRPTSEDLEQERKKARKLETDLKHLSAKFDEQAAARHKGLDLLESARADLTPLLELHPALSKVEDPTPAKLAEALVQNIAFDLNEVWNHLPVPPGEALVTPSTTTIEPLLRKLRRSVTIDRQRDEELDRKWKQALAQIQSLQDQLELQKAGFQAASEEVVGKLQSQLRQTEQRVAAREESLRETERKLRDRERSHEEDKRTLNGFYSFVKWVGLGTGVSLEQVKRYIDDLKERANLEPFRRLHPSLAKLKNAKPLTLAAAIAEIWDQQKLQSSPELGEAQEAVEQLTRLIERLVRHG